MAINPENRPMTGKHVPDFCVDVGTAVCTGFGISVGIGVSVGTGIICSERSVVWPYFISTVLEIGVYPVFSSIREYCPPGSVFRVRGVIPLIVPFIVT